MKRRKICINTYNLYFTEQSGMIFLTTWYDHSQLTIWHFRNVFKMSKRCFKIVLKRSFIGDWFLNLFLVFKTFFKNMLKNMFTISIKHKFHHEIFTTMSNFMSNFLIYQDKNSPLSTNVNSQYLASNISNVTQCQLFPVCDNREYRWKTFQTHFENVRQKLFVNHVQNSQ